MRKLRAVRMLVGLCLALIAAQAVLPHDVVLCAHDAGGYALELAHHGRCLGVNTPAACTAARQCAAAPALVSADVSDAACQDQPLLNAELRPAPAQATPARSLATAWTSLPVCTVLTAALLPARALHPLAPPRHAGPPAAPYVGCVMLRI